jgi:4-hydroxybenzoyl-CoA thioesterase
MSFKLIGPANMARIKICLPDRFLFETVLEVRISDINYGNHMSNDAILRFAHEARLRFFMAYGYTELDVEGLGIIMADAAICYRAQAFHGERLRIKIGVGDPSRHGFDMIYQAINDNSGIEVARLKTGIVFFDYTAKKIALMPGRLWERLQEGPLGAP